MNEKMKSRKFILACSAMVSIIVFGSFSLFKGTSPAWLSSLMPVLAGVVGAYVGVQGLIDKNSRKK